MANGFHLKYIYFISIKSYFYYLSVLESHLQFLLLAVFFNIKRSNIFKINNNLEQLFMS